MRSLAIDFGLVHSAPRPFIYPFVYQPTSTTLGLSRGHNPTNRVSGVDTTSLWGPYPRVLSDTPIVLPSVPMFHPWNKHQTHDTSYYGGWESEKWRRATPFYQSQPFQSWRFPIWIFPIRISCCALSILVSRLLLLQRSNLWLREGDTHADGSEKIC